MKLFRKTKKIRDPWLELKIKKIEKEDFHCSTRAYKNRESRVTKKTFAKKESVVSLLQRRTKQQKLRKNFGVYLLLNNLSCYKKKSCITRRRKFEFV